MRLRRIKAITIKQFASITYNWYMILQFLIYPLDVYKRQIPVCVTVVYHGYEYWYLLLIIAILMSAVVIIRHRKNIVRIFKGEENKFSFGRKNR